MACYYLELGDDLFLRVFPAMANAFCDQYIGRGLWEKMKHQGLVQNVENTQLLAVVREFGAVFLARYVDK